MAISGVNGPGRMPLDSTEEVLEEFAFGFIGDGLGIGSNTCSVMLPVSRRYTAARIKSRCLRKIIDHCAKRTYMMEEKDNGGSQEALGKSP